MFILTQQEVKKDSREWQWMYLEDVELKYILKKSKKFT